MSMVRVWNCGGWDVWRRHLGKRSGRCRCQSPGPLRRVSGGRWPDWDEEGVSPLPPKEGILVWYPEQSENGVPAEGQPVVARCWNPMNQCVIAIHMREGRRGRKEAEYGCRDQTGWGGHPLKEGQLAQGVSQTKARKVPAGHGPSWSTGDTEGIWAERQAVQCRVGRCPHEVVGRVSHRRLFTHRKVGEIW